MTDSPQIQVLRSLKVRFVVLPVAETVRREWITMLLSRKTLPKDAERVIALGLTTHRFSVSSAMSGGSDLAHTLLGLERPSGYLADALAVIVEANPGKARLVSLAVVFGGIEAINGRLKHLHGTALGFRDLTHYIARSLLEAGGFRPKIHF